MQKIELAEHDGYLHDNGKPQFFIFRVNGKPFPVMEGVTIGEFYRRVSSLDLPPEAGKETAAHPGAHLQGASSTPEPVRVPISKGIEVSDTIRCIRLPEDIGGGDIGKDNEKAVVGKEYLVQKIVMKNGKLLGYEVIPINSDWAQRVFLRAQDVELVQKAGPKPQPVDARPQTILPCLKCGKDIVYELNENADKYTATCEDCLENHWCSRSEISCAACGERNNLMLYKDVWIGRCKKCEKEQKITPERAE